MTNSHRYDHFISILQTYISKMWLIEHSNWPVAQHKFNLSLWNHWKIACVSCLHALLDANEAILRADIVHRNLLSKLRSSLSSRRLLKTQMERVKLNKSINWVSAKSQSSKTNRFKVLNEKDNRIREPDIQRERHFTVLDPVNHLVGYPRVQVQEWREGAGGYREGSDANLWVRTPFIDGFFSFLWGYHG